MRFARAEGAEWDYLDGRWDEAIAVADELIAAASGGDQHYTDPVVLALRAWIRLARGDSAGADRDSERAVALARVSDVQAQSAAYCIRAAVARECGSRAEANELASELAAIGSKMVGAFNTPFPTLVGVAWVFRDLGRESEFSQAVLDANSIESPWNYAARSISEGDFVRAAETIDGMGHTAGAAYARLRAAEALQAAGQEVEAATQRAQAEPFFRNVGAAWFLGDGEQLGNPSAAG
jgi:hypothetical protein